jgi:hypothetical protein
VKEKATGCGKEWKGASRWAYSLFLLLVVYCMFAGNYADAVNNLCIALILIRSIKLRRGMKDLCTTGFGC